MIQKMLFWIWSAVLLLSSTGANAQLLNQLEKSIKGTVNQSSTAVASQAAQKVSAQAQQATTSAAATGVVYYVSAAGSNRADGLTPATAKKDIQKVLDLIADNHQNGATVRVAEGNYLGYMDAGYIEIRNFITLQGGWNSDFTQRNPLKYQSKIEPTVDQRGTNGSKALIQISGLDDINYTIGGTLTIDGMMLNLGFENEYFPANPDDEKCGCPKGCETGRMADDQSKQLSHSLIHNEGAIAGNVVICNCLLANSPYFGIQINTRCGEIEVYNNVIISCRMAGVRIDGWDKLGERSHVNFHHNTVAFAWCRDKVMEDMGYGYEFMNKVNADVHHNLFLCNNYAALARTRIDSDKAIEAKKVTSAYDNLFFMNAADLQLPAAGGGKWLNVACRNFEDVDEKTLRKVDGNKELAQGDPLIDLIDAPYLKGYSENKVLASSSFDPNSAANLYRQAHGMNMQGTETIRVKMFGNRYNYAKALLLFGAKAGYGAQKQQ